MITLAPRRRREGSESRSSAFRDLITRVARTACVAITFTTTAALPARAQLLGKSIEVYATFGGVAGVTPVRVDGASHTGVHAGFRFDAGLQFEHLAIGPAIRVWELSPTSTYGGHGVDLLLQAEWRADRASRTAFRATYGPGFDDMDGGHGPDRPGFGASGGNYSLGVQREVFAPSDLRLLLSADLVMPSVNTDPIARRRPVLEFGVGYRFRTYQDIAPLPQPRPRGR